jgi:hypothetical protein
VWAMLQIHNARITALRGRSQELLQQLQVTRRTHGRTRPALGAWTQKCVARVGRSSALSRLTPPAAAPRVSSPRLATPAAALGCPERRG